VEIADSPTYLIPVLTAIGALIGVFGGRWLDYEFRRRDHRREQQLAAYSNLLAKFDRAVAASVTLRGTYARIGGKPEELSADIPLEQRQQMSDDFFSDSNDAMDAHRDFIVASYEARLTGGDTANDAIAAMNSFMRDKFFTRRPWNLGADKDELIDFWTIGAEVTRLREQQVELLARQLWGKSQGTVSKINFGAPSASSDSNHQPQPDPSDPSKPL
jgi:hypothetical protein